MNQLLTKYFVCLGAFAMALPAVVSAETLDEAWAAALGYDPVLQASRDQESAAEEELAAAKSLRMPSITASAGITRFNEAPAFDFSGAGLPGTLPLFGGEQMEMADARVTLPLYTGGAVSNGIAAAAAQVDAQAAQSDTASQQLKLEVARHYINVLRAQRALMVADSAVTSLRAHVTDVDNRLQSGDVARNDYLAAAVSLADTEQRRLQARNALDLANAAYNRLLGRALDVPVNLGEQLPGVDPNLDLESLANLTATAVEMRHELDGLQAASAAYRSQAAAARGNSRPQFAVTGAYMNLQNEFLNRDDFWMVGVGVRWNLFDGGASRRKASALNYRAQAIARERANLESLIELQVRQAWLRLNETQERKRISERTVEQAEENLRVVRDRYRNGEGTNTEVLDAETLRSLSRSNFDNAEFDAQLALYELARGVGKL